MKSNLTQEFLKEFYLKLCKGNEEAFYFVSKWSVYCHKFDDLVDENFDVIRLVETNVELHEVLTCPFFRVHGDKLLPLIYLAAESYQASETTQKDTAVGGYLSHEGNNVLRVVALICGDYKHFVEMSEEIRRMTYVEHPDSFEVVVNKNN
jgi:hypothetical protein